MKKKAFVCFLAAAMLTVSAEPAFAKEAESSGIQFAGSATESVAESTDESMAESAAETAGESNVPAAPYNQTLDVCYTLALNAINEEDYEAAKDYLSVCFGYCDPNTDPDTYADLLLKQACINSIEEKNDLALRNLDAAIRIRPDLADAYLVRTEVNVAQGNVDKAVEDLEKYIELTEDTSLYATVAQLQEAKGDMQAAQDAYDKYVQGSGEQDEEAGFQSGLYRMQNGSYEEAIEAFETYRDDETFGAGALYNIGVCKMDMGDYAGAVEAFDDCEEKGGTFEGLYYNRGVCHLLNEEWEEGAADFESSIENEPYVDDATYNLAVCQMQQEEYETAIDTFTAYINGEAVSAETLEEESAEAAEGEESTEAPEGEESTEAPEGEESAEAAEGEESAEAAEGEESAEAAEGEESAEAVEGEESTEIPKEENEAETDRIINYGAYYYRAVCEGAIGRLEEALADYTACIDNGYELTQSYYQRAQVYAALGDAENQNLDLAESLKYTE